MTHNIQNNINVDYTDILNKLMQNVCTNNDNQEIVMNLYNEETGVLKGIFVKTQHEYENFKAALNCGFVPSRMNSSYCKFGCNLPEIFSFFPPKMQNDLSISEISSLEQLIFELMNVQEQLSHELKNLITIKVNENQILEQKISALMKLDCFKDQEHFLLESENLLFDESVLGESELGSKFTKQSEIKEKIKALIFN
jgi:hypothetical protein